MPLGLSGFVLDQVGLADLQGFVIEQIDRADLQGFLVEGIFITKNAELPVNEGGAEGGAGNPTPATNWRDE